MSRAQREARQGRARQSSWLSGQRCIHRYCTRGQYTSIEDPAGIVTRRLSATSHRLVVTLFGSGARLVPVLVPDLLPRSSQTSVEVCRAKLCVFKAEGSNLQPWSLLDLILLYTSLSCQRKIIMGREIEDAAQALLADSAAEREHARVTESEPETEVSRHAAAGPAALREVVSPNLPSLSFDEGRSVDEGPHPIPWSKFIPLILFRMIDAMLWTTAFPFMSVRRMARSVGY